MVRSVPRLFMIFVAIANAISYLVIKGILENVFFFVHLLCAYLPTGSYILSNLSKDISYTYFNVLF